MNYQLISAIIAGAGLIITLCSVVARNTKTMAELTSAINSLRYTVSRQEKDIRNLARKQASMDKEIAIIKEREDKKK